MTLGDRNINESQTFEVPKIQQHDITGYLEKEESASHHFNLILNWQRKPTEASRIRW